jgi:HSP20 family protein
MQVRKIRLQPFWRTELSLIQFRINLKVNRSANDETNHELNSKVIVMALIRWQPFQEIDSLQRDMNRLFDRLGMMDGEGNRSAFVPAAELQETSDAIHLRLEVPGMNVEDLDVHVTAEAVSLSGERREESTSEDKGVSRTEFRYGRFQRVIPLPVRVQNTEVQANYKDGILKLTLPKAEEEKNKVVKVNLG